MKKKLLLAVAIIFSISSFSQSKFSVGIHSGYDMNRNHLDGLNKLNRNELPDFNLGVDLSYYLNEKIRIRGEVSYRNISFLRDYGTDATVAKNISHTKNVINNLSIAPHIDYRLAKVSKLDIFVSGGVSFEFLLDDWQRTYNQGGDLLSGRYVNETQVGGTVGAVGGLIFKYNVNDKIGISLSPEYTHYFKEFYTANTTNFQRMSLNLGLEWRF